MNFTIKSRIPFPNTGVFYFRRMFFWSKSTSGCRILKLFSEGSSDGSNITKAEVSGYSIYQWLDPAHMVDLRSAGWMLCLTKALNECNHVSIVMNGTHYLSKRIKFGCPSFFLKKSFWRTWVLFVGPLILLFWTSGDASSGFQSQSGFCLIRA